MKCTNCQLGTPVHYVTLDGAMRPAIVLECNDDDCGSVDLTVFTGCTDQVPSHNNEPTHPAAHIENVQHDPGGAAGTYHLPSEMPC